MTMQYFMDAIKLALLGSLVVYLAPFRDGSRYDQLSHFFLELNCGQHASFRVVLPFHDMNALAQEGYLLPWKNDL